MYIVVACACQFLFDDIFVLTLKGCMNAGSISYGRSILSHQLYYHRCSSTAGTRWLCTVEDVSFNIWLKKTAYYLIWQRKIEKCCGKICVIGVFKHSKLNADVISDLIMGDGVPNVFIFVIIM